MSSCYTSSIGIERIGKPDALPFDRVMTKDHFCDLDETEPDEVSNTIKHKNNEAKMEEFMRTITKYIMAFFIFLLSTPAIACYEDLSDAERSRIPNWRKDACWCLNDAHNRLHQQPLNQGNCGALLTGGLLASYFSNNAALANFVLTETQNDWAHRAKDLSRSYNPQDWGYAISLILACQCHNTSAQNEILNNRDNVLNYLRNYHLYQ